jgi:hypothetical protein
MEVDEARGTHCLSGLPRKVRQKRQKRQKVLGMFCW